MSATVSVDGTIYVCIPGAHTRRYMRLFANGMVRVPSGSFLMGSATGRHDDEHPLHRTSLSGFYLDIVPTTNIQYARFCSSTGHPLPSAPEYMEFHPDHPVVNVSYEDALAYCAWASKRLPTEAEWEYACRAGTTGDTYGPLDDIAWYGNNSDGKTHPVGEKVPNVFGLYDMLGSVWEWCADWYSETYYAVSPEDDPPGPTSGDSRVCRGGSWDNATTYTRSAYRFRNTPDYQFYNLGFRCARDLPS